MSPSQAEVLVTGGGPAGAVAALVLARAGRDVVLVESAPQSPFRVGESLPPAAKPLLRDLGLLAAVEKAGHLVSSGNVAVWGSAEPRAHDFLRDPHGTGWHLDRARFDADLQAAAAQAGARLLRGVRVSGANRCNGAWRVSLRQGGRKWEHLTCRWLVDASGRRAVLARRLGGERLRSDRLVAFVGRFRPRSRDGDGRTWIEATPDGWWYAARLPDGELVAVFHSDADLVDRRALRTAEGFLARLATAPILEQRRQQHGYQLLEPPRATDASSTRCHPPAGPGWLAVGDAALAFDPLSSQGIFNALYTGLRGAQTLVAASDHDDGSVAAYCALLDEVHHAYLAHRITFYGGERRWPERPFWRRRQKAPSSSGAPRAGLPLSQLVLG